MSYVKNKDITRNCILCGEPSIPFRSTCLFHTKKPTVAQEIKTFSEEELIQIAQEQSQIYKSTKLKKLNQQNQKTSALFKIYKIFKEYKIQEGAAKVTVAAFLALFNEVGKPKEVMTVLNSVLERDKTNMYYLIDRESAEYIADLGHFRRLLTGVYDKAKRKGKETKET